LAVSLVAIFLLADRARLSDKNSDMMDLAAITANVDRGIFLGLPYEWRIVHSSAGCDFDRRAQGDSLQIPINDMLAGGSGAAGTSHREFAACSLSDCEASEI
jgi:hypothetical protein